MPRTTRRAQVLRSLLAALILAASLFVAAPGTTLATYSCATGVRQFMTNYDETPNVKGAQADIEYVNEDLCSGGDTFSSYWVAVGNFDATGANIFQIGVDECRALSCPPGNPVNTPYYFWAYGHSSSSACGPFVGPEPQVIAGTPSGTKNYKVVRAFVTPGSYYQYEARIDGSVKYYMSDFALTTCWGGVDVWKIGNESYNTASQAGGPSANYQDFEGPRWYNGSAWQVISRPAGSNCDEPASPSRGCKWSTVTPDTWRSWDTRF